ncbi:MAG: hypothetical protein ACXVA9_03220 [Bdellovibrionales bacterium]
MNTFYSKIGLLAVAAFISHSAMASLAVECGSDTNVNEGTVNDTIVHVSSDDDNFAGRAGTKANSWGMTYKGQEYPPNKATARMIWAKGTKKGEQAEAIEITVIIGNSPTGPVGERLLITGPYDDEPKLEIFNIGGVTGPLKTGTYKCLSYVD